MTRISALISILILNGAITAFATTIPYTDPANQGSQAFGGNLALTFDVNSPITVDDLGVFNASGSGDITGTIDVAIYNTVTDDLVTPVVSFSGMYTPMGFDVFQSITPVVLGPGAYEVDAVGFSSADQNGNLATGSSSGPILNNDGGALTFTGAAYDFSTTLDDPGSCSGCSPAPTQDSQFDAGTFEIGPNIVAAPEPGYFGMLALGLVSLLFAMRRKVAQ